MKQSQLGFGITGTLEIESVRAIARRAQEYGLASLWINDTPGGDSLARLEVAAAESSSLILASGVIAVDRKPAAQIVSEVRERDLPTDRLIIGIGSSAKPSPLQRISEALSVLRDELPARTVVGSLGPRMRQLGAEQSNGLLFNWLPPQFAAETSASLREQAAAVGNQPVLAATYIRTALGAAALPRLREEAARYSAIPSYAANFERLGITAMESSVHADDADGIRDGLLAFDGAVDHAIVRAITPNDDLDHYLRLLEAIAPLA